MQTLGDCASFHSPGTHHPRPSEDYTHKDGTHRIPVYLAVPFTKVPFVSVQRLAGPPRTSRGKPRQGEAGPAARTNSVLAFLHKQKNKEEKKKKPSIQSFGLKLNTKVPKGQL